MDNKDNSWIKSLYQRSWEMELLISGFVLVFLLQSFEYQLMFMGWITFSIPETSPFIHLTGVYIVGLLQLSIIVLSVFLVLNLAFRAYWIALIGLVSRVKKHTGVHQFSANRKQNILQVKEMRSTFSHIDSVDKWGSQLFSIAFLFLFLMASTTVCFILFMSLSLLVEVDTFNYTVLNLFAFIYAISMIIFIFDMFSGGMIGRIRLKVFNVPYFYVYTVFRYISLFFLYERIALNARGNGQFKVINLTLLVLIACLAGIATFENRITLFQVNEGITNNENSIVNHKLSYLSERRAKGYLTNISLDKPIYHQMPIKVFVPLTATIAGYIKESCDKKASSDKYLDMTCLDDAFKLRVNEAPLAVKWHSVTHIETRTKGITAFIDLPELSRGEHQFSVKASYLEAPLTKSFWYYPK